MPPFNKNNTDTIGFNVKLHRIILIFFTYIFISVIKFTYNIFAIINHSLNNYYIPNKRRELIRQRKIGNERIITYT